MYARRLQLINYGPIPALDIQFSFEDDRPKPVVLVGANGSGKTLVLSHIVNGLIAAKDSAFPDTPEVEPGKVYKLRSGSYITSGQSYYLAHVQFDQTFSIGEIVAVAAAKTDTELPSEQWSLDLQDLWRNLPPEQNTHFESSFPAPRPYSSDASRQQLHDMLSNCCMLYFPSSRFEDPAWLNQENLTAPAQHMDRTHLEGHTDRSVIASSPLSKNRNWLFDIVYDRAVFELETARVNLPVGGDRQSIQLPVIRGYFGDATAKYELALEIVRTVIGKPDARFGIGNRAHRVVSVESESGQITPNLFQMSSGETALLNLFLSILRDCDLAGAPFTTAADVRGIVVVDEIDLHLHVAHQRQVLPKLVHMFPKVQFVVTTHSPLFVLGMQTEFGEDGLSIYRLPEGQQISAEEFSEFGEAYEALRATQRARDEVKEAIDASQRPIVFVEGPTDVLYLKRAARVLEKQELLDRIILRAAGSDSKLDTIWKAHATIMREASSNRIVLLYDCDASESRGGPADEFKVLRRFMRKHDEHPIAKGIENLFSRRTLEWVHDQDPELFEITPQHPKMVGSQERVISERWALRSNTEKQDLCKIVCASGDQKDFGAFEDVLQTIEEAVG